jgi:hypothetical protein
MGCGGADGLPVDIKSVKFSQKIGIGITGLNTDFSADAVSIDDAAYFDGFQSHSGFSFCESVLVVRKRTELHINISIINAFSAGGNADSEEKRR